MKIEFVNFNKCDNRDYYLEQFKKSLCQKDYQALIKLLGKDVYDKTSEYQLHFLVNDNEVISYAILKPYLYDELEGSLCISNIYTIPKYRGHHYGGVLVEHLCYLAKMKGLKTIYAISSIKTVFDKYGFKYLKENIDKEDLQEFVYIKFLKNDNNKYIPLADQEMLNQDKYEGQMNGQ